MINLIALYMMINSERSTYLTLDPVLSNRAELRAEYLCAHNQWSHDGWLTSFKGIEASYEGENLAKGFKDATSTNQALMASPTHKGNIVNWHYWKVGLGQACGITVELFKSL